MTGWFTKVGAFLNSIRGFIWLAFTGLPTVWVYVSGVYAGLNWPYRILVTMATLASGAILVHYSIRTYDYLIEKHGVRREINAIIDALREMAEVGHEYLKVDTVVKLWAGDDANNVMIYNPKLRKIKQAMTDGEIDYQERSGGRNPSQHSAARIDDLIRYFERLKGG